MDLEDFRRDYLAAGLERDDLDASPFLQFERWMQQAISAGLRDPTAMCLATVGPDGRPWQRFVLLKHCDERGFVFYTNLESRKATHIAQNPRVSLHFPWSDLERQVTVAGTVERVSGADALR
jgi:pyridoxamine 5'-phosphate oxidase